MGWSDFWKSFFGWRGAAAFILLVFAFYLVWISFFGYSSCESWTCFNKKLSSCEKSKFIGGTKGIFEYKILGKSHDGRCLVNVKLLQAELNNQDSKLLEGKEMLCSLPFGVVMLPESDLGNCHGILKENLQDAIIKKLHSYIVKNLGKINKELLNISGI